jgi:hypothetical protein
MSDRILTMNEKDTLPLDIARLDLLHILDIARPTIAALEEWGPSRDAILETCGYSWARGPRGGGPVLWDEHRGRKHKVRSVRLAFPEFVGHLPGRKTRLGANFATEVILGDLPGDGPDGSQTVVIEYHLTAEVQDRTGKYLPGLTHALRVRRHKKEKHRLGRRARMHKRRGAKVYVLGDSNFDGMQLGGFVNCWTGHPGGSLGGRAVDIVFAATGPVGAPHVMKTHSDHQAVVVTYP